MDALALLRLMIEWGADEGLAETPVDRLRPVGSPSAASPSPPAVPRRPTPLRAAPTATPTRTPPQGTPATGIEQATTLDTLREAMAAFDGCALRTTASNLVFADGNPQSGLLIIGDAPSDADDRSGRAFDGPAGAYLDRMLQSIGLDRSRALLTPLLPWRPPGGRPPTPPEVAACLPFLHRLIALASPRRVVLIGPLAARAVLGAAPPRRARGWLAASVPGLPNPLPALILPGLEQLRARPAGRREAWAALRLLRRAIDEDIAEK